MFAYFSEVAFNYMSMSALVHDSADVTSQTIQPVSAAAFVGGDFAAGGEQGYRDCLAQIKTPTPSEACLTTVARWRSEKLMASLQLQERLGDVALDTAYIPASAEAPRPQLEVRISGRLAYMPGPAFAWGLSARAAGGLR